MSIENRLKMLPPFVQSTIFELLALNQKHCYGGPQELRQDIFMAKVHVPSMEKIEKLDIKYPGTKKIFKDMLTEMHTEK